MAAATATDANTESMKIGLAIYGELGFRSGGFLYDRQLKGSLERLGHSITVISLPWGAYPMQLMRGMRGPQAAPAVVPEMDILIEDELCHPSLLRGWRGQQTAEAPARVGLVHHLRSSEQHPTWLLPLYRAVESSYLRSLDGFIFNSVTTLRSVEALLQSPADGVVAWPGKDHFRPPSRPRTVDRGKDAPLRLLAVGSLSRRKGADTLLKAMQGLPRGRVRLDWIGSQRVDPRFARKISRLAQRLQLTSNVTFHGETDEIGLHRQYSEADVFVLPSHYEGFGIVYVEAMAYGVPILAGRAGGAGEILEDGVQGFLVDSESVEDLRRRIADYMDDPQLLRHQGQAARDRFELLPTWAESGQLVENYLQGLVGSEGMIG